MPTLSRTSTTDMEVTSIRLERDLKERLKAIAGERGYQALIRDILWQYLAQKSEDLQPTVEREDIRASLKAIAQKEEYCALTGTAIAPQTPMLLGLTTTGELVPLSLNALA
ncbi:MAG: hypothetical protein HC886_18515 [Leptolyngbyaceae cyanobacterium SM1_1_3]|nr:hypothetical protein [Leptolyngbyaceae cyanobacterium SM1_1_3]NJN03277.1 hypothetical protein [Leptolyngbyaceae cyanobacterium RM1_1_2]NJO09543.1 hypothetical protein [Leptolyngbyaceae cyanobacterium SL_1_1]